jgi:ribonuclease PH
MTIIRIGRSSSELRPLSIKYNILDYPAGSVMIEFGKTKVLCAVSLVVGVPQFLRNKGQGWLTAEYAMLPAATSVRTARESVTMKRSGRSVEISRMIGRSLRLVVDLDVLGERTIHIDCDVIQADGSTRAAAITGACQALLIANDYWLKTKKIAASIIKNEVIAISAGLYKDEIRIDLDAEEDNDIDTDINFVFCRTGELVELQGTAEQCPVSWPKLTKMHDYCQKAALNLFTHFDTERSNITCVHKNSVNSNHEKAKYSEAKNPNSKPLKNPIRFVKNEDS